MRIAVPSWVIPGTYAENLRFLAGKEEVDTVELLFFLYDAEVRSLLDTEWDALSGFRGRFGFTAHLPDRLSAGHEELVERLSPLVSTFVAHPYPVERADDLAVLLAAWTDRYGEGRFLLENTSPGRFEAAIELLPNVGVCFDTGHWLLQGGSVADFIRRYGAFSEDARTEGAPAADRTRPRIGEVHLHAVDEAASRADGRLPDHRALAGTEEWLDDMIPFLRAFSGTVDLEVFSWREAEQSVRLLESRGLVPERKQR